MHSATDETRGKSDMEQKKWDEIDPTSLLPLIRARSMTEEFGFLLRHYWIPASELVYESTIEQSIHGTKAVFLPQKITRTMLKCDTDVCLWREHVQEPPGQHEGLIRFSPAMSEEYFCIYNRSRQTFRTQTVRSLKAYPEDEIEANKQAFLQQPILTPLLPIPLGFRWHTRNNEGYMDFWLESKTVVNDMPVLFVRREGRFSLHEYYHNGLVCRKTIHLERKGISVFAHERSVLLADRTCDTIKNATNDSGLDEIKSWSTLQLLTSKIAAN